MSESPQPKRRKNTLILPDFKQPLPQSIEGEAATISCLVQWPKETLAMMTARGMTREVFSIERHRIVALAVFDLTARGQPVEFATLSQLLIDRKQFETVGGADFVSNLFHAIPSGANTDHYLSLVAQKFTLRTVILESMENVKRAYEEQEDVDSIVGDVAGSAHRIAQIGHRANKPKIAEIVMKVINDRQKAQDAPREVCGLSTFWPDLDAKTGGLLRGNLRCICAPPNTGKTIALLNELECVAIHHGMPALIIEPEITRERIVLNLSASLAWLPIDDIRNNKLTIDQEKEWCAAMAKIAGAPITLEAGDFNRKEVVAIARAWKANHPNGRYIALDGLQLLRHWDRENRSVADEIKADARALKMLANELDVTVSVASHQTGETAKGSRGPEELADMMLLLSDDELKVKKSRSGGKGFTLPITIDSDHQRIIQREEDEQPPKKKK